MRKALTIIALCFGLNAVAQSEKIDFHFRKGFTGHEIGLGYSFHLGSPKNELTLGVKYRFNPSSQNLMLNYPTFVSKGFSQRMGMYFEYRHYFDRLGNKTFRPFVYGDMRLTKSSVGFNYLTSYFDPQTQLYDYNRQLVQRMTLARYAFNVETGFGAGFTAKINNKLDFYNKIGYSSNHTILYRPQQTYIMNNRGVMSLQFGMRYTIGK